MRPHDGRAIPTFLRQALQDKPVTVFGDGSQTRSFCYVDDLIRGFVLLAESDVHLPVNLGNPKEMTLLELAEAVIDATGLALGDRLRGPAGRRPPGAPAGHHAGEAAARLGAGGRAPRRPPADDRAGRRRAARRRHGLSAERRGAAADRAPDGDLPPVPGRRRQHRLPLREGPGRAGPPRRGLHRTGRGRGPGPRRSAGAPDQAGLRDRERSADPEPRGDRRLRRGAPALPVHLRLRADAARPAAPAAAGGRPSSSTTRTAWSPRAPARSRSRPTSTRSRRSWSAPRTGSASCPQTTPDRSRTCGESPSGIPPS